MIEEKTNAPINFILMNKFLITFLVKIIIYFVCLMFSIVKTFYITMAFNEADDYCYQCVKVNSCSLILLLILLLFIEVSSTVASDEAKRTVAHQDFFWKFIVYLILLYSEIQVQYIFQIILRFNSLKAIRIRKYIILKLFTKNPNKNTVHKKLRF